MNYKYTIKIKIIEEEYWWGGSAFDGPSMPFDAESSFSRELNINSTPNQAAPILLSSKGRYIWCNKGFNFEVNNSVLTINSYKDEPLLYEGFENLRGAFLAASKAHFNPSGKSPASLFFERPQYNTWIELIYNQSQVDVLNYAQNIVDKGMPIGVLMIDCGWAEYYGGWRFHVGRFPDAKEMVDKLHDMGFKVMLWTCPFISCDSIEYRYLRDKKCLVFDKNGNPSIKQWWDGFSAVLDFTNPDAVDWFDNQNEKLINDYNIDGFKLDAGDAYFYSDDDVTFAPTDANGQSELWARFGLRYEFNEYRACFKCGGEALAQRLCDKQHSWGKSGIASLVPSMLADGIIGHPYTCPDMIGGGEYLNFMENSDKLDQELFVRYAQCAALMPMMQYSAAPWRVLSEDNFRICKEMSWLHTQYADLISKLVSNAEKTGEPIVRYMDYVFPNEGLEKVIDQFMLGDEILIAPVIQKGVFEREVAFPKGIWCSEDGTKIAGGCKVMVKAPLNKLPVFRKIQKDILI